MDRWIHTCMCFELRKPPSDDTKKQLIMTKDYKSLLSRLRKFVRWHKKKVSSNLWTPKRLSVKLNSDGNYQNGDDSFSFPWGSFDNTNIYMFLAYVVWYTSQMVCVLFWSAFVICYIFWSLLTITLNSFIFILIILTHTFPSIHKSVF